MRHIPKLAIALTSLLALGQLASAGTVNLSTGLDASRNLITADLGCDAYWTETNGPATNCANSKAQVVHPGDADWGSFAWLSDGPGSDWITAKANQTGNGFPLPTYQIQFYLANTTGASFTGSWSIDDAGFIALNGSTIGSLGPFSWGSLSPVNGSASSHLVAGLNTLSITTTSSDNFLEAVRFQGSVTGNGASLVPEPSSVLLALAGIGGVLLRFRNRRSLKG